MHFSDFSGLFWKVKISDLRKSKKLKVEANKIDKAHICLRGKGM